MKRFKIRFYAEDDLLCRHSNIVIADNHSDPEDVYVETDSSTNDDIIERHFDKETLNKAFDLFNISPIKDVRETRTIRRKSSNVIEKIQNLSSSSLSDESQPLENTDLSVEDKDILITGLKRLLVDSTPMETIRLLTIVPDTWGRKRIEKEFGCTQYQARQSIVVRKEFGILPIIKDNRRRQGLPQDVIEKVIAHYCSDFISRQSPNCKDVINIRQPDGTKVSVPCRHLLMSINECFEQFKEEHQAVFVGRSSYYSLRPKWVKFTVEHSSCHCLYHENYTLLTKALSDAAEVPMKSVDIVNLVVCDDSKMGCMHRNCQDCCNTLPSVAIIDKYKSLNVHDDVDYMQWQKGEKSGVELKRINGTIMSLLEEFDSQWSKYISHCYTTTEQFKFIKELKANVSSQEAIVQLDFAENMTLSIQRDIQTNYWSQKQSSIITVHIKTKDDSKNLVIISDASSHDTKCVYHCQTLIINLIKQHFPNVKTIIYLSDGAGQHFKNKYSMLNLCLHHKDFGLHAQWLFYSTSHGKGPCDGLGSCVKAAAYKHIMRGDGPENALLTPVEFYEFSKKTFSKQSQTTAASPVLSASIEIEYASAQGIEKTFESSLKHRWNQLPDVKSPIQGIREFHHFLPMDENTISCKLVSSATDFQEFKMIETVKISKTKTKRPNK
ncbi:unnamed protein product [Rotaria socialis]|uniref:Uncharacterized protein n=2 Tax=Rotaria socialis TaxID=392032 RepID=A0A821QKQ3_9BILA|nr:unnamed protein product [Rotaria socialis]CAF4827683.1 unnamed protein product [Rotaria socialis]